MDLRFPSRMELDSQVVIEELGRGRWADRRLRKRAALVAERLIANPALSFPKAFSVSAELEAAYRFFGNPLVNPDAILDGHFNGTRQRSIEAPSVLVIHDTTTCAFRADGDREGLGRIKTTGQAFFAHAALVVSDDGVRRPIGVAHLKTWVRTEEKTTPGSERARWAEGVDAASVRLAGAKLIHVMDREADDYSLLYHLVAADQLFVIRSLHDRILDDDPDSRRKLGEVVAQIEQEVVREAKISKRTAGKRSPRQQKINPTRRARIAKLSIGFAAVTLRKPRPHPRDSERKRALALASSLPLNVVRVWEADPPEGEPAVEWVILTNASLENVDDALQTVERYRARWIVEEYFKALKTGCAYETRQLGDYESLINAFAVFAPIACTLLALRSDVRRKPAAPAETVITKDELEVLRVVGRMKLPSSPTAKEVLLAIAAMGGHIKYNGDPGWKTLWSGYSDLKLLTQGWLAAKLQQARDQ